MKTYTVTVTIETEIKDEAELERILQVALDSMRTAPYLDWADIELVLEDECEG